MTQVNDLSEVGSAAKEIRTLWIGTEYTEGRDIPLPSTPSSYSGKFNVRLPRALHRRLSHSAGREGVSLNQYVVSILSVGEVEGRLEKWLESFERRLETLVSRSSKRRPCPSDRLLLKAPKRVKSRELRTDEGPDPVQDDSLAPRPPYSGGRPRRALEDLNPALRKPITT
jgi:hypothetical protein